MKSSELARLAGVSLKTLRHYHKVGLLAEPVRQENGYRDYDVSHVIRLLRVRQLVRIGLPLVRIKEQLDEEDRSTSGTRGAGLPLRSDSSGLGSDKLLGSAGDACPSSLQPGGAVSPGVTAVSSRVLDELDASLAEQIALLERQRRLIASVRPHAEDLDLAPTFRAHLARLRELGASDGVLAFERGNLMLMGSLYGPDEIAGIGRFFEALGAQGRLAAYLSLSERLLCLSPDAAEEGRRALIGDAVAFAAPIFEELGARETLWEAHPADHLVDDYEERRLNAAQADVSARIWRGLVAHFARRDAGE